MKKFVFLQMLCLFTLILQAQNFSLVKDINTSKDGNPVNYINNLCYRYDIDFVGSEPGNGPFAMLNGVAYFAADDGVHGKELWRSDNTASGTYMVKDITAGSASTEIQSVTVAGNKIFFVSDNNICVTDGTKTGTTSLSTGIYGFNQFTCLTAVNNLLYFVGAESTLWKTDGTSAGTSLVADFRLTYGFLAKDYLGQLTNVNGTLFFTTGLDTTYGPELWKSDGTGPGTVMIKDIYPGVRGSGPSNLTSVNGKLYFSADDGTGISLWVSDGSSNGTNRLVNKPGVSLIQMKSLYRLDITPFSVINQVLYFKGYTSLKGIELYKYDLNNSAAGITLVKDLVSGIESSNPSNLTPVDSSLFFSVSKSTGTQELWKSDGTKAGTVLVKDMAYNYISSMSAFNKLLLFSFNEAGKGCELWSSDGTLAGTTAIKDIYPGAHSSNPSSFSYFGNNISLFCATDGSKGIELWSTDGTNTGTLLVKNINNTSTAGSDPFNTANTVVLNDQFYFSAYDPVYGNNLYVSNGTRGSTHLVKDINNGNSSNPTALTIFKNTVYFAADSSGYTSVYKTDGTSAGTIRIFNTGKRNATVTGMYAGNKYLYAFYYYANDSTSHLWVTDGTALGSHEVQNLNQEFPAYVGLLSTAAVVNNTIYFSNHDSVHGYEFWKATSAVGSAQLVKDIFPGPNSSSPLGFVPLNNNVCFIAIDSPFTSTNTYLYISDGTANGTQLLHKGQEPVYAKNRIFFTGYDTNTGYELYTTDGTEAGTHLVKDIRPGASSSTPRRLTSADSILYFQASDSAHGTELWKSDGTGGGTVLVKDVYPGSPGSYPWNLTAVNGKLYFQAYDATGPNTLYVSNGKAQGTYAIGDSGLSGVNIRKFAPGGDKLYIDGYTYASGSELYAGLTTGFLPHVNNAVSNIAEKNRNFKAIIMGNPIQDELKLLINSYRAQHAQIIVTDVSGKTLINKSKFLDGGINNISYPCKSWAAGVYAISIVSAEGSIINLKAVK